MDSKEMAKIDMSLDDIVTLMQTTATEQYGADKMIRRVIKKYARHKCKEQRELCADETGAGEAYDYVLNAPEPKFD